MEFEDAKWYVVHTYSGYENKVASNIEKVVDNRNMQDQILDVKVPTEIVTEIKDDVKRQVERKLFPGYVLVKFAVYFDEKFGGLKMTDEAWYVVRNARGVTGFVGPESKPVPLTDQEVYSLGVEKYTVEVNYSVGDTVTVIGGPFDGSPAEVRKIDTENNIVEVSISIFGRETPLTLPLDQVERPE